jgi:hypothetical protein
VPPAEIEPGRTQPPGHASDSELEGLIDGELGPAHERGVREHLETCGTCAARHRGARLADRRIAERLALLDHDPPDVHADALMDRGGRRVQLAGSAGRSPIGRALRTRPRGAAAAAAAIVVLALGAAAAVIPGSPARRALDRVLGQGPAAGPPPAGAGDVAPRSPSASGVSFVPEPDLEVVFLRGQPGGEIRITLVRTPEVRVRAVGGDAAYTLDPARLVVDNSAASASYEIQLPGGLQRARVRVGRRIVFEKSGEAVRGDGLERNGTYAVPFGGVTVSPRVGEASREGPGSP